MIASMDEIIVETLKVKSDGMVGVVSKNEQEHQFVIAENKRSKQIF